MNRETLAGVINTAKTCLSNQTIAPIMTHLRFDTKHVIAFNGVQGIQVDCPTDLDCAVPGVELNKLVNSFSAKEIDLVHTGDKIAIKCGKSAKTELGTMPSDQFVFPIPKSKGSAIPVTADFLAGIKACIGTANTNPTAINQFGVIASESALYSTDTHRISRYLLADDIAIDEALLIPLPFCNLLVDIGGVAADGEMYIIKNNSILVKFKGIQIFTMLAEDVQLEDLSKLFSEAKPKKGELIDVPELLPEVLERCLIPVSKEQDKLCQMNISDDSISFQAIGGHGNHREMIDLSTSLTKQVFRVDIILFQQLLANVKKLSFIPMRNFSIIYGKNEQYTQILASMPTAAEA